MTAPKIERPCRCCQKTTPQEAIPSMSAGSVYYACSICRTVTHEPRPQPTTEE